MSKSIKTVLVGVCGGIAAFKALELVKLLIKDGLKVRVMMTQSATQIISPEEFEKVSGCKVYSQLFAKDFDYQRVLQERQVDHIELASQADLTVIVPATANIIGKIANGLADDFLTTTVLALTQPVIIAPAMNVQMWANPIVRENLAKLRGFEYKIIEPVSGMLACGYQGLGRLEEIEVIRREIHTCLNAKTKLKGQKIIVTAGGTIEPVDQVRFIANKSSGKMGLAIAKECFMQGAKVLLLRAKSSVKADFMVEEKGFETSEELLELVKKYAKDYQVFYHAAAVADFKVQSPYQGKLSSKDRVILSLVPQPKILDQIKKINPQIKLIAFKAEYGLTEDELLKVAYKKLKQSGADAIIANDVSLPGSGFESDSNEVYIILADQSVKKVPLTSKREVAKICVDYLSKLS